MKFDRVDIIQAYMLFDRHFGHKNLLSSGILKDDPDGTRVARITRINKQVYRMFKHDKRSINMITKKYMTINCKDIYKQLLTRYVIFLPDEEPWLNNLKLPGGKLGYAAHDEKDT
jgi:hypothetical protein